MLRAWQNESTFGKHDHVSNVAATMCPRFAGPLEAIARSLITLSVCLYISLTDKGWEPISIEDRTPYAKFLVARRIETQTFFTPLWIIERLMFGVENHEIEFTQGRFEERNITKAGAQDGHSNIFNFFAYTGNNTQMEKNEEIRRHRGLDSS